MAGLKVAKKALDMAKAARMKRAREMGFDPDTVMYHGTGSPDIEEFTPSAVGNLGAGVYFTPKAAGQNSASSRAAIAKFKKVGGGSAANVIPTYLRKDLNYLDMDGNPLGQIDTDRLKAEGYDGIRRYENGALQETNVFDPKNIRSKFAAFDPAKADSPNLMAGIGALGVGAGLAGQSGEAEAGISKAAIKQLKQIAPSAEFSISSAADGGISLNKLVIPKGERGQGQGSKFMAALTEMADEQGVPIVLDALGDFGGSRAGQRRLYQRFGFEDNTGRKKDFRFTENMIREPMKAALPAALATGAALSPEQSQALERMATPSAMQRLAMGNIPAPQEAVPARFPVLHKAASLLDGRQDPTGMLLDTSGTADYLRQFGEGNPSLWRSFGAVPF